MDIDNGRINYANYYGKQKSLLNKKITRTLFSTWTVPNAFRTKAGPDQPVKGPLKLSLQRIKYF